MTSRAPSHWRRSWATCSSAWRSWSSRWGHAFSDAQLAFRVLLLLCHFAVRAVPAQPKRGVCCSTLAVQASNS